MSVFPNSVPIVPSCVPKNLKINGVITRCSQCSRVPKKKYNFTRDKNSQKIFFVTVEEKNSGNFLPRVYEEKSLGTLGTWEHV